MTTRVVIVVDVPGSAGDSGPGVHWLDSIDEGVKSGIADAFHLEENVEIIRSIVTDPEVEEVRIHHRQVSGVSLKISG
jgi:hypothetical protein